MRIKEYLKITFLFILLAGYVHHSQSQTLAFPGAEGYGRFAHGGRGGDVYHVTNLNDSGIGSLRYGIQSTSGHRTIVFDIAGNIQLKSKLKIDKPYITIAGQTSQGEGITLAGHSLQIDESHIIVRYIRCRFGNVSGAENDAVTIVNGSNIIFDHVTASWSVDETFSCQSNTVDSLTVQWCMITESLCNSIHSKGAHGYGGIIGGTRQSFHHNLYAHHSSRNPKVTGRRHCEVDFRNNVIYNWGFNSCYDGTSSYMNWVNNYYKAGPATKSSVRHRIFELSDLDILDESNNSPEDSEKFETSLYAEGNYVDGFPDITANNWVGGIDFMDNSATEAKNRVLVPAFNAPVITQQTAIDCFPLVLESAGSSLVRDIIDKRIIHEVQTGTTTYGNNGIIDSQTDVGGWPALISLSALTDTDQDGMPDAWEIQNGLNINNPDDRNDIKNYDGYSNLENYLNSLIANLINSRADFFLENNDLNCYPNPNNGSFYVDLRAIGKSAIEIYNPRGIRVYQKKSGNGVQYVKINEVDSGFYLVKVTNTNKDVFSSMIMFERSE